MTRLQFPPAPHFSMLEGRAPELKPENLTFNIELLGDGGGFENNCVSKWPRKAQMIAVASVACALRSRV